jgi:hypothetical protein
MATAQHNDIRMRITVHLGLLILFAICAFTGTPRVEPPAAIWI